MILLCECEGPGKRDWDLDCIWTWVIKKRKETSQEPGLLLFVGVVGTHIPLGSRYAYPRHALCVELAGLWVWVLCGVCLYLSIFVYLCVC